LVAYEQSRGGEEEDEVEADGANYQLEMMRCLREVNVDNNTVGWYDCLSRAGIKNVFIHAINDNVQLRICMYQDMQL
jgi:translation initiation factor 3 subunit H